jgi:hypothetical protein
MTDNNVIKLVSAGAGPEEAMDKFRRSFEAGVESIKRDLAQWLDQQPGQGRETTIASNRARSIST